jgi:hypothetical protein
MKFTMILIVSVLLEFTTHPNTAITKTILNINDTENTLMTVLTTQGSGGGGASDNQD